MEDDVKYYVFVKNGRRYYDPQQLSAGETIIRWIFPVPEHNTVGTLDKKSNGIVLIKFGNYGTEPERVVIVKDYLKRVYDLHYYRFSSNYTDDTIAYSQTQGVVIANLKVGEAFYAKCGLSDEDYLLGIRFLDPQNKVLVLVKSFLCDKPDIDLYWDSYLHVAKLEGKELIDIGWNMCISHRDDISSHFPLYYAWDVHNHKLFAYDKEKHKIACTDGKVLQLHPFSEGFNANSIHIGKLKDLAIHPKLPFAVIIEEHASNTHNLITLRWDITDPKKMSKQINSFSWVLESLKSLFGLDNLTLAYPSFSPDGNWYVVGLIGCDEWNIHKTSHFVAIPVTPVDKKHLYFLDINNIVVLGQVTDLTSIAWTFNPTSYVVSNGELLHKWDLDELPNARVFETPEDGTGERKSSIFRKIARFFGLGR